MTASVQYVYFSMKSESNLPHGSGFRFGALRSPSFAARVRAISPGFWESFLLWLRRGCIPVVLEVGPFKVGVGGALNPDGGLLELVRGEGDDRDD